MCNFRVRLCCQAGTTLLKIRTKPFCPLESKLKQMYKHFVLTEHLVYIFAQKCNISINISFPFHFHFEFLIYTKTIIHGWSFSRCIKMKKKRKLKLKSQQKFYYYRDRWIDIHTATAHTEQLYCNRVYSLIEIRSTFLDEKEIDCF